MAINFPNSPSLNQEAELGGKTYKWDGTKWVMTKVVTPTAQALAPTITVVSTSPTGVTFTLTNNDDNTAIVSYTISTLAGAVSLASAATSSNITVDLAVGTYTLTAVASVVGEVAQSDIESVEIVIPQYEELFSTTVATATTQIDITGLNIGKDDGLRLVYTIVGDSSSSSSQMYVYVNNDTTLTNYYSQQLFGDGSSIGAARTNNSRFGVTFSIRKNEGFLDMKISNNDRFVAQSQNNHSIGANAASNANYNFNIVNTTTISSITSLSVQATRTNGIAVGSKIALYKVTEAA